MGGSGLARTFGLYFATAIAELVGCYLPLLWRTDIAGVALARCGAAVIALGQRTA